MTRLQELGIRLVPALVHFVDAHTLCAGDADYRAPHVLIATGPRPRPFELPGGDRVIDSDGFFRLDARPSRAGIIGGGYISADRVLTFRNVHDFLNAKALAPILKAAYNVLKPGGVLGITDHRAKPFANAVVVAHKFHRITEDYVINAGLKAGFQLAGVSEINANPKDPENISVFLLPPELAPRYKEVTELLLSGSRVEMEVQLGHVMEGYRQLADFNPMELNWVEALRTLRMIHYATWIARRQDDSAFPRAFLWFDAPRYWEEHIQGLREQISLLDEPPLTLGR